MDKYLVPIGAVVVVWYLATRQPPPQPTPSANATIDEMPMVPSIPDGTFPRLTGVNAQRHNPLKAGLMAGGGDERGDFFLSQWDSLKGYYAV